MLGTRLDKSLWGAHHCDLWECAGINREALGSDIPTTEVLKVQENNIYTSCSFCHQLRSIKAQRLIVFRMRVKYHQSRCR